MSKYLRYYGEFLSVDCHENRVAIYQESDTPFVPEEIQFPADSPLLIEWNESNKYDVMLGSSCTVKMFCPEDRKFLDAFYQIKYGDCRVDIFRDGEFYWTGCLDTECYEEPYESTDGYVVTTYWSDLSYLSRAKFDMGVGFKKVTAILLAALYKTQCIRTLHYSDFDESFEYNLDVTPMTLFGDMPTSTMFMNNLKYVGILTYLYVRTDNFCDETGEWDTWEEVLIAILQPLGIRLTQVGGFFYLYDINGLYNADNDLTNHNIYWTSDSQNLAIDSTYNNIKITWSPYAQSDNMLPTSCFPSTIETSADETALNNLDGRTIGDAKLYTYPLCNLTLATETFTELGFSLWLASTADNITLGRNVETFKMIPQFSGSEDEGVAVYYNGVRGYLRQVSTSQAQNYAIWAEYKSHGYNPISRYGVPPGKSLFTSPHTIVPPQSLEHPIQLKLTMECLVDCRINPFEDPFNTSRLNSLSCSQAMQRLNLKAQFLYIPVRVCFKPINSTDIYYYDNMHCARQERVDAITELSRTYGYWRENDTSAFCYLAYYLVDAGERQKSTALCKWTANRQCINPHRSSLSTVMQKMDDGQYITYPTINNECVPGEMWVEVMGNGWLVTSSNQDLGSAGQIEWTDQVAFVLSMALVKLPELEIINKSLFNQELSYEDVVYNAEVNAEAKEELSIDTKMGSYVSGIPTARGVYFKSDGSQFTKVYRNINGTNKLGTIEQFLCGTLFSQYHDKHVVLSGECRLDTKKYLSFTEDNQSGKKFMCVSEVQDLRADTMDAKYVEITPDEYVKR